jgi:hypothetical protein
MKTRRKIQVILLSAAVLVSCNRKENDGYLDDSQALVSSQSDEDLLKDEELLLGGCNFDWTQVLAPCVTVTETSEDFPKTITIDYGTGCTNSNGVTKAGKVIIFMTAPLAEVNAKRDVTFENFKINNVEISGERHLENTGINAENQALISVEATMNFAYQNVTRTRTVDHIRAWKGYSTCELSDDEYFISGSGSASRNGGVARPYTIDVPVHLKFGCSYPLSGVINIGALENRGAIIDYGDGTCDEFAEITLKRNDNVYVYNMLTKTIE